MADGQILIDTRIRTDEVKQDTANLKKQLESLADSASASAKKIDRSFDNLSIDDAADGLGESFEQEARMALALLAVSPMSAAIPGFTRELGEDAGTSCTIGSVSIVVSIVLMVTLLSLMLG